MWIVAVSLISTPSVEVDERETGVRYQPPAAVETMQQHLAQCRCDQMGASSFALHVGPASRMHGAR